MMEHDCNQCVPYAASELPQMRSEGDKTTSAPGEMPDREPKQMVNRSSHAVAVSFCRRVATRIY
jgi:hypothetical protein